MTIEKKSAGPAMQRPQPISKALQPNELERSSEAQLPVGSAPGFDRATERLVPPGGGMLANPVVQQYTHAAKESTVELSEVKNVDAGSAATGKKKKPARKPPPKKKSQKRG
jgi:hypothetical protein